MGRLDDRGRPLVAVHCQRWREEGVGGGGGSGTCGGGGQSGCSGGRSDSCRCCRRAGRSNGLHGNWGLSACGQTIRQLLDKSGHLRVEKTGGGKGANASPVARVNPHHQEFGVRD